MKQVRQQKHTCGAAHLRRRREGRLGWAGTCLMDKRLGRRKRSVQLPTGQKNSSHNLCITRASVAALSPLLCNFIHIIKASHRETGKSQKRALAVQWARDVDHPSTSARISITLLELEHFIVFLACRLVNGVKK